MILDALALFSDAQALTATANSTSSIDLTKTAQNIGVGENMYVHINVDVAFTDGSSDSTITVTLVTDDNAALSSPTTVQTLGTFAALSAIGTRLIARIQPGTFERYIGLVYTTANGNLTTGSVTAALVHDVDAYTSYAKGYTIS